MKSINFKIFPHVWLIVASSSYLTNGTVTHKKHGKLSHFVQRTNAPRLDRRPLNDVHADQGWLLHLMSDEV